MPPRLSPHLLALADYRRALALDERFVAPPPLPSEERAAAIEALLYHLDVAPPPPGADPRRLLDAALTERPPHPPLEGEPLALLDRLLAAEGRERSVTDALRLPRLDGAPLRQGARLALWQGDITRLSVDAIVNAANRELCGCFVPGHRCIDNAIHAAAGPRLRADCFTLRRLQGGTEPTGAAKATRGYHLPARYVLHTVGPIVAGGLGLEHERALASCYRACLDLAAELGARSLALCAISTGVFGFPRLPAARIALDTVDRWLDEHRRDLDLVVFDLFGDDDLAAYRRLLDR